MKIRLTKKRTSASLALRFPVDVLLVFAAIPIMSTESTVIGTGEAAHAASPTAWGGSISWL